MLNVNVIRWMGKLLKETKGISTSLVEAGATVAVGLTLAAAIVPVVMDKGQDSKIARAQSDTQALATSIQTFFADVQEYPSRKRTGSDQRDSGFTTLTAFRTGDDSTSAAGLDPKDPSNFSTAAGGTDVNMGNLNNHLVTDVSGSGEANYRNNGLNWKGPYSKTIHQDPWGRNYVVLARAASYDQKTTCVTGTTAIPTSTTHGCTETPLYYWVLSAGPDGSLDTTQSSSELQDDDVGTVVTGTKAPATTK